MINILRRIVFIIYLITLLTCVFPFIILGFIFELIKNGFEYGKECFHSTDEFINNFK